MSEEKHENYRASEPEFSADAAESLHPAVTNPNGPPALDIQARFAEVCRSWLKRSTSRNTRSNYARDLEQFLRFAKIRADRLDELAKVRPEHIAAWRDSSIDGGLTNNSVRRKMTVLRSLFSYLKNYGYTGANPAHSDFVDAPAVPRDGKTVGLTAAESSTIGRRPATIVRLLNNLNYGRSQPARNQNES